MMSATAAPATDAPANPAPAPVASGFTMDWFSRNIPAWQEAFAQVCPAPRRILEIGAFEGRATCWMIENLFTAEAPGEIICVDTWRGGDEHQERIKVDMDAVYRRFRANVQATLRRHRGTKVVMRRDNSAHALARLVAEGAEGSFDAIYVDGSHTAPDVLADLVLSFRLCKPRGLIICDDYLWQSAYLGKEDVLAAPKIAIDAFTTIFRNKLYVLPHLPLYQLYMQKLSD